MIKKKDRVIKKEQFGTEFVYFEENGVGRIEVRRLDSDDVLQTIKFWGGDRLKTHEQFRDACTVWCDQNIA